MNLTGSVAVKKPGYVVVLSPASVVNVKLYTIAVRLCWGVYVGPESLNHRARQPSIIIRIYGDGFPKHSKAIWNENIVILSKFSPLAALEVVI